MRNRSFRSRLVTLSSFLVLFISGTCVNAEAIVIDGDRARVTANGFTPSYAGDALKSAEQGIDFISSALGYLPHGKIDIILTRTDREFQELTGGDLPEWSAAVAVGDNRIIVTPLEGWKKDLNRILVHELAHVFIEDAAAGQFVPRWFHEGVAQTLAGEWGFHDQFVLGWRTVRHDLLTFDQIQNILSSGRTDAGLAYDQSMMAIRHLRAKSGDKAIPAIIQGLRNGNTFAVAFQEGTGVWPSEFEKDYLEDIERVYGRSFYFLIPSVWTFILLLAAVVYIIKRRRNRELLRRWEVIEAAENIVQMDAERRPGTNTSDE